MLAPAASTAKPPPLVLEGTNPASPGASLTPRLKGRNEEAQTKVVIPRELLPAHGPVTRGLEPGNAVKVYAQASCAGTVVAEGTVLQLDEEGIPLSVAPESTTTFSAKQSNGVETSDCSLSITYRQVSSAPDPPGFVSVSPASPANDNFPLLIGTSGDPEAMISIYENSACSGLATATGSAEEFEGRGIEVSVPDNSETTFYAKALVAGFSSICSVESISYQELTPPPTEGGSGPGGPSGGSSGESGEAGGGVKGSGNGPTVAPATPVTQPKPPSPPQLRTVPGGIGNDTTPLITGTAPGATVVFVYASADCTGQPIAKGSADQFASTGFQVQVVPNNAAVFSAVAGVTGAQSKCSAPVTYSEDSLSPHTRITMGPAAKTAKRKAVFRFTDANGYVPGTAFFCKVDRAKWKPCTSPFSVKHLKTKSYVVSVRAVDEAGNAEAKGTTRRFKVIAGG